MTRQEILLNRFKHIKQMWLNAPEGSDLQKEAETKMEICLKEMKKARNNTSDLGSSVMNRYIILSDKSGQKGTEIKNTMEDNHA